MTRLLNLDVSLNCTGWSVLDVDMSTKDMKVVDYGYIPNDKEATTETRVNKVYKTIKTVCDTYQPDVFVGESPFMGTNAKTLMQLTHTHGVLLLLAAQNDKRIYYYSPMTIKSTVLGGAKAKDPITGKTKTTAQWKNEVKQKMIEIFGVKAFIKDYTDDVTDAMAIGVTYVYKEGKDWIGEKPPVKKARKTKKKADEKGTTEAKPKATKKRAKKEEDAT